MNTKNIAVICIFACASVLCACKSGKKEASIDDIVIKKEKCSRPKCYPSIDTAVIKNVPFFPDAHGAYECFTYGNDDIKIEHDGCNSIIFKYVIRTHIKENEVNNTHLKHSLMVLKEISKADISGAQIDRGADSLLAKITKDEKNDIGIYSNYDVEKYKCQVILSQAIIENDSVKVWVTYSLEDK